MCRSCNLVYSCYFNCGNSNLVNNFPYLHFCIVAFYKYVELCAKSVDKTTNSVCGNIKIIKVPL